MEAETPTTSSDPLPGDKPKLERVDGRSVNPNALESRRFNIRIESVRYSRISGGISCAVLLKTTFHLRHNDQFASALVPLVGIPQNNVGEETNQERIEISGHFPSDTEWAQVGHLSGTRDVSKTPNVSGSVLGNVVSFAGMGVNTHRDIDRPSMVSLNPVLIEIKDNPTRLNWEFEDKDGIFYPPSMYLLVIVEKVTAEHTTWFPFELRLQWEFRVDLHGGGGLLRHVKTLVAKLGQHDGWCFRIKGEFKPEKAEAALAARSPDASFVGLRAAVRLWESGQKKPSEQAA